MTSTVEPIPPIGDVPEGQGDAGELMENFLIAAAALGLQAHGLPDTEAHRQKVSFQLLYYLNEALENIEREQRVVSPERPKPLAH